MQRVKTFFNEKFWMEKREIKNCSNKKSYIFLYFSSDVLPFRPSLSTRTKGNQRCLLKAIVSYWIHRWWFFYSLGLNATERVLFHEMYLIRGWIKFYWFAWIKRSTHRGRKQTIHWIKFLSEEAPVNQRATNFNRISSKYQWNGC